MRYSMSVEYYRNPKSIAIDLQICDILIESNHVYQFHEIIQDYDKYTKLTDNILDEILVNDDSSLYTAKDLIQKLKNEEFYQPILQVQINPNDEEIYQKITSDQISSYSDSNLKSSDIRVDTVVRNKKALCK